MSEKKERGNNIEYNTKKNKVELNYYLNKIVLKKGKLFKSERLLDDIYLSLLKKIRKEPFFIIDKAIKNVRPIYLLRNTKIGKRVISIPIFYFI
jgi:ribosomal protein S7